jgi:putative flippase GtrA
MNEQTALTDKTFHFINFLAHKFFKRNISDRTFKQLLRHYLVGATCSLINYVLFNILIAIGPGVVISNSITYIFVVLVSFFMQKYYTYQVRHHSFLQPLLFVANSICYFVFDTLLLLLMIRGLQLTPLLAKLLSIALLAPTSFLVQKFIVFKERSAG